MKKRAFIFLLLLVSISVCQSQSWKKARLGISFGGAMLSGGSGFIFESARDQPHRDGGALGGLVLAFPLDRDVQLITSMEVYKEWSHLHFTPDIDRATTLDAAFEYTYIRSMLTLNHSGKHSSRQKVVLKEFAGLGLNFGNLESPTEGEFADFPYSFKTEQNQSYTFNPIFVIGVGLISKPLSWGQFHYEMSIQMDLLEDLDFSAFVKNNINSQARSEIRKMRGLKGEIRIIYFPRIRIKKKNCFRN